LVINIVTLDCETFCATVGNDFLATLQCTEQITGHRMTTPETNLGECQLLLRLCSSLNRGKMMVMFVANVFERTCRELAFYV